MTAARIPTRRTSFTSPVVDYEPPLVGPCPSPRSSRSAALHRHTSRPLRPVPAARPPTGELAAPRAAVVFADAALRRILEVTDRRRPVAQLRPLVAPALFDAVVTLTRTRSRDGAAVLRRVRLRSAEVLDGEAGEVRAAEVFATYSRGRRIRAIAGRVELVNGRWTIVAIQVG